METDCRRTTCFGSPSPGDLERVQEENSAGGGKDFHHWIYEASQKREPRGGCCYNKVPGTAITKYHKLGSLEKQPLIVSQFWRPCSPGH